MRQLAGVYVRVCERMSERICACVRAHKYMCACVYVCARG